MSGLEQAFRADLCQEPLQSGSLFFSVTAVEFPLTTIETARSRHFTCLKPPRSDGLYQSDFGKKTHQLQSCCIVRT